MYLSATMSAYLICLACVYSGPIRSGASCTVEASCTSLVLCGQPGLECGAAATSRAYVHAASTAVVGASDVFRAGVPALRHG